MSCQKMNEMYFYLKVNINTNRPAAVINTNFSDNMTNETFRCTRYGQERPLCEAQLRVVNIAGRHSTTRSQTAFFKCNSRSGHLISPLSLTKWRQNLSVMQPVVVGSKSRPTRSLYSVHDPCTAKTKGHNEYQFYSATLISMKTIALPSK